MLTGHGYNPDQSLRCLEVSLKLLQVRTDTVLLRLCALEFLVQIRPFEMNAQDPGSLISLPDYVCNIFQRLCQNLFGLRDRRGKKSCNTLADNTLRPSPQAFRIRIIRIKTVSAVRMYINKARHNAAVSVIPVRRISSVRMNGGNLSVRNLNLCIHPLIQHPDSFTLQYHGFSFLFPDLLHFHGPIQEPVHNPVHDLGCFPICFNSKIQSRLRSMIGGVFRSASIPRSNPGLVP